jgi:beta-lactamase class A
VHGKNPFAGLAGTYSSSVTAAVYDAITGKTYVLHKGVVEDTASIVKVEIMGTLLKQAQTAGSPLPGTELALMTSMIEASDNSSATQLLSDAGGPSNVKQFDESVGMTNTEPHDTTPYINGDPGLPAWGLTKTTAADEVKLVRAFAYGPSVLSSTNRKYGINLMSHIEADQDWGVSGGVAPGTAVALKNGWLPLDVASSSNWQVDSIGWIKGNGRDYVLAVLTNGNASEQAGIDTISHLSDTVYSKLGH